MEANDRRDFMKAFLSVPVFRRVADLVPSSSDFDKRVLMVQICRLVNTAELWHKIDCGRYATTADLLSSRAMERLRRSDVAERRGIGKSLIASVSLASQEVMRGCELQLRVFEADKRYLFYIRGATGRNGNALFASDESGVIYEGTRVAPPTAVADGLRGEQAISARAFLADGRPLGVGRPKGHGFSALLASVALPYVPASILNVSGSYCDPSCGCDCSCQDCDGACDPLCTDCGCCGCVWCCCPY